MRMSSIKPFKFNLCLFLTAAILFFSASFVLSTETAHAQTAPSETESLTAAEAPDAKRRAPADGRVSSFRRLLLTEWSESVSPSREMLQIEDPSQNYILAPYIFHLIDDGDLLTRKKILDLYNEGRIGEPIAGDILSLGVKHAQHWLVFRLTNHTEQADWILDFGTLATGRYAIINTMSVFDASRKTILFDSAQNGTVQKSLLPNGAVLSVNLPPGEKTVVAISLRTEGPFPSTLRPRLSAQPAYIAEQDKTFDVSSLVPFFLGAAGLIFLTLAFMIGRPEALIASLYFLLQYGLYHTLDVFFCCHAALPWLSLSGETLVALFLSLSLIAGLFYMRFFFIFESTEIPERLFLYTLVVLTASVPAIQALVPQTGYLHFSVVMGMPLVVLMSLTFFSFFQMQREKYGAPELTLGWSAALAGYLVMFAGALELFDPQTIILEQYWTTILVQAVLFVIALYKKSVVLRAIDFESQGKSPEFQDDEEFARIKRSKDASDQIRLMRVIERERELLAEMRRREEQRTEEMRIAKDRADEANRAKSAFLAVISHEIRTPMTGVMGMVRLLMKTPLDQQQKDYIRTIMDSSESMMALLNDILDFEKIDAGKMDLEIIDLDLHRLIQSVIMLMSGHASEKNLELKSDISEDTPQYIKADPTRLRQILLNLCGNALKFTRKGSVTIRIKCKSRKETDPEKLPEYALYFAVQDTGIGIPEDAQAQLFNPFSQADSSISRKYGGSGLGLAICRRLIEAMGGKIGIESEEGQGSTFFFTLQVRGGNPDEIGKHASTAIKSDGTGQKSAPENMPERILHILVVDDNKVNRDVVAGLIGHEGHNADQADSGDNALEKIEKRKYDMILMDIQMPGMRGEEATRRIRQSETPRTAQTPVFALTGNVMESDIRRFEDAGMNGFLPKPISPEDLNAILGRVIRGEAGKPVFNLPQTHIVKTKDAAESAATATTAPSHDKKEAGPSSPELSAPRLEKHPSENRDNPLETPLEIDLDEPEEKTKGKFSKKPKREEPLPPLDETIFDHLLLATLRESLNKSQFQELLDGYKDKAVEIIEHLEKALKKKDFDSLRTRAHELKGMAGNFGFRDVSRVAEEVERDLKVFIKSPETDLPEDLEQKTGQLRSCHELSWAHLTEWIEK